MYHNMLFMLCVYLLSKKKNRFCIFLSSSFTFFICTVFIPQKIKINIENLEINYVYISTCEI